MNWDLEKAERRELEKLATVYEELNMKDKLDEVRAAINILDFKQAQENMVPAVQDALATAENIFNEFEKMYSEISPMLRPVIEKIVAAMKTPEISEKELGMLSAAYKKLESLAKMLTL